MSRRSVGEYEDGLPDVVRDVEIAIVRIEFHRCGPIELRLWTANRPQRLCIAACIQRVDLDGRRQVLAGTGNPEIAVMPPRIDEEQPVLFIDRNPVRRIESRILAGDPAQWLLLSRGVLAIDHHFRGKFDRHEKLLLYFVGGNVVHTMRRVQDGLWADFSVGFARKPNHLVAGVGLHRKYVTRYRIHI